MQMLERFVSFLLFKHQRLKIKAAELKYVTGYI